MNTNPKWWNEEHTSAWNRVKAAVKRDWEQKPNDWETIEPTYRYGVGARHHDNEDWNDRVDSKMKEESPDLKSGRTWDEVKAVVQRGRGK